MIRLERTFELALVRTLMTHPKLYPFIADDFGPVREEFEPNAHPGIVYLLAFDDLHAPGNLLGVVITHAINPILWEVHHCLLPHCWGERARAVGRALSAFMWECTAAKKLVGFTPACNPLAVRFAKQIGWTEAGRVTRAYQRGGALHDLIVLEHDLHTAHNGHRTPCAL